MPAVWATLPANAPYPPVVERLKRNLVETFPALAGIGFSHAWSRTMAFTRDFIPRVGTLGDEGNLFFGLGDCGEGVVMSQVAGRILAGFAAGEAGEFASLPFVGSLPPWVGFEPLRAIGVSALERRIVSLSA